MTTNADPTGRLRDRGAGRAVPARARMLAVLVAASTVAGIAGAADPVTVAALSYRVVADGIPERLAATPGDAVRGRALVVARDPANCVLCHAVPDAAIQFAGDLGPSLAGVGERLSAAQLRLRVANNLLLNPATIMPGYYNVDGLDRVAPAFRGKPILSASETEDIVAYLGTLR
jgi:sulfur-oxidizing protein SoxX